MAKKEAESTALDVPNRKTGLSADTPDWVKSDDRRGTEDMAREDMQIPRLGVAQLQSPQLVQDNPKYVEGLQQGFLYNDLTGEVFGKGPLEFAVLRQYTPRGIQFAPIESGGGVIDPDVPLNDPRMQFTTTPEGKRKKPIATKYYDFIILLLTTMEPIALSLKGSGIKTAKQLKGFIGWRKGPLFAGKYTVHTEIRQVPKPHYVYVVKNAGWLTQEQGVLAEQYFNQFRDVEVVISRDAEHDDATSFDPNALETETVNESSDM